MKSLVLRFFVLCCLLSALFGCSGNTVSDAPDGSIDEDADLAGDARADGEPDSETPETETEPPNLEEGTWNQEVLFDAPTMVTSLSIAHNAEGYPIVSWDHLTQSINLATRNDTEWVQQTLASSQPEMDWFAATIVFGTNQLHMTYQEAQDTGERPFYRRGQGSDWGAPLDVTSEDPDTDWNKGRAQIFVDDEGSASILYSSSISPSPHDHSSRIRLVRIVDGHVESAPELIADEPHSRCRAADIVQDIDGNDFLLVACEPLANAPYIELFTNRTGSWTSETLSVGSFGGPASLAVDPDGRTIHFAWTVASPGESEVRYAKVIEGVIEDETALPVAAELYDLLADQHGRPLVLSGGHGLLQFSWSDDDGETFNVREFTFTDNQWPLIGSLDVDPSTGFPRFVFILNDKNYDSDGIYMWYEVN